MASMTYTQKLISGLWLLTGYRPLEGDVVNYLTGTDYETLERWAMANGPTWAAEGQLIAAAKVLATDTKDVTQVFDSSAFLTKTNRECMDWMIRFFQPLAIPQYQLPCLWSWQEQQRRFDKVQNATQTGTPSGPPSSHEGTVVGS